MTAQIDHDGELPTTDHESVRVCFQQTVPRSLVHRAAVSEVFITDLAVCSDQTLQAGAQWPRSHSFFGPKCGVHDPLLLAETIRQAGLAFAHRVFGVPQDAHFLLDDMSYEISERGVRLDNRPADIVMVATPRDVRRRGGKVVGMRLEFECFRDTERVGSGSTGWRCVSPATYARLRGNMLNATHASDNLPTPIDPCNVGRMQECDVVLGDTPMANMWLMRADTAHPVIFDHPVDHVPGMMIMEAARQAAQLALGQPAAVPLSGSFSFARYIEYAAPCVVTAEVAPDDGSGRRGIQVRFDQRGHNAATADLEVVVRDS